MIIATNKRFEVAKEKKQKREEIIEKRKIKIMMAKHWRAKSKISLPFKEKENYESNTRDKMNSDQADNDKNWYQFWEEGAGGKYKQ